MSVQLSKFSILEYSVRNTCNPSKTFTMPSWTSRRRSTEFWHAALWASIRLYNINANLIRTIECLYDKATSAVYNIGEWYRTIIGVRQGCLLSPTLFNIFLEKIMADALEDHEGKANIGGRPITNLRFADDIDGLAGQEQELIKLINHIQEASTT